ncbi:hypothetical protein [Reyranella sp.]|uniref:hypothetical protein n=1 Tax=Reyranella sp. TaxID=1929291 RepID=UPI00272721E2|nr:hypothetical protein [Reyranella sp.]MDO8974319.1 hypothetical protein [Reyranella sp.]
MMPLVPLLLGIAPTVVSWIMGDKTGAAVSKVTGIAREILGTDDASGIERAIAADPNLALQFKMAVIQAEADARRQEFGALQAQLADVQSARSQTVKLAEVRSPIAYGAVMVSAIVLVGFAVMLWLVIREEVPANQRDMVTLLLGTLAGMASSVVAYWVGSSSGSMQKNAALERVLGQR